MSASWSVGELVVQECIQRHPQHMFVFMTTVYIYRPTSLISSDQSCLFVVIYVSRKIFLVYYCNVDILYFCNKCTV